MNRLEFIAHALDTDKKVLERIINNMNFCDADNKDNECSIECDACEYSCPLSRTYWVYCIDSDEFAEMTDRVAFLDNLFRLGQGRGYHKALIDHFVKENDK